MLRRRALLAAGAALAAAAPTRAGAQKFADTLRVSWSDGLDSLDPYATSLRSGLALMEEVWDGLIWRDPETLELVPLLATRWRQQGERAWEFTLRRGVWFHDGSPFGPEDVVATVRRIVAAERVAVPANYTWLAGAEAVASDRVRIDLAFPFPAALRFFAAVLPILSGDRSGQGGASAAIGTGPWRLDAIDPLTRRIALARHETYWPSSPKGAARIRRLEIRQPDDPATPYNDLVSGRADWTWQLTPDEFAAIEQAPNLKAIRADSMRVAYLALDAAGRSDPRGPLTRLPVRQAVCHAIDRAHLASLAAPGGAQLLDTPCYPDQFGCDAVAATAYPLDRDAAHALLAQAGLPDGFATTLVTNARPDLAAALAHDLTKIGIRTTVLRLAPEDAMAVAAAGRAPLFLGSWGSSAINDMAAFLPIFFAGGALDTARLPGLADTVRAAERAVDADRARGLYAQAIATVTGQACFLPLFVEAASYGIDRTLRFHPTPDELPRFYRMDWQ